MGPCWRAAAGRLGSTRWGKSWLRWRRSSGAVWPPPPPGGVALTEGWPSAQRRQHARVSSPRCAIYKLSRAVDARLFTYMPPQGEAAGAAGATAPHTRWVTAAPVIHRSCEHERRGTSTFAAAPWDVQEAPYSGTTWATSFMVRLTTASHTSLYAAPTTFLFLFFGTLRCFLSCNATGPKFPFKAPTNGSRCLSGGWCVIAQRLARFSFTTFWNMSTEVVFISAINRKECASTFCAGILQCFAFFPVSSAGPLVTRETSPPSLKRRNYLVIVSLSLSLPPSVILTPSPSLSFSL